MWAYFLLFVVLAIIIFQDIRERKISTFTIPLTFIPCLFLALSNEAFDPYFLGFNYCFLLLQFVLLSLYFSIKNKKWIKLTKSYLGLGYP